jgi:uncharacterized protein YdhG (YjbR/CyaY superfamily)
MKSTDPAPRDIDDYIAAFSPPAREILERIRRVVRKAAPEAKEKISYRMPAFEQGGILIYFAAFQHHIGVYPPVSGDLSLTQALAPYTGEKGNLRFPYAAPMPYELIERIVALRLKQNLAKAGSRSRRAQK